MIWVCACVCVCVNTETQANELTEFETLPYGNIMKIALLSSILGIVRSL